MTKTENLQDLVKCQNLLREASFSNNGIMKKQVIYQINNGFPDIADEVMREWDRRYPRETLKKVSVFDLTPQGRMIMSSYTYGSLTIVLTNIIIGLYHQPQFIGYFFSHNPYLKIMSCMRKIKKS